MSLDCIKIDRVYTNGGEFYRTVGWLGQNSVVFEKVTIYSEVYLSRGEVFRARRIPGRRVYQASLNEFSKSYREPTREELEKAAG